MKHELPGRSMDYVTRDNIQRFERMLAGDLDPEKHLVVEGLLAEQKAKLAGDVRAAQEGCAVAGGGECRIQLS